MDRVSKFLLFTHTVNKNILACSIYWTLWYYLVYQELTMCLMRRAWQPTSVFLPRDTHGQRNLVGYSPQGHKELDTTEVTVHACMCLIWSYSFWVHCSFSTFCKLGRHQPKFYNYQMRVQVVWTQVYLSNHFFQLLWSRHFIRLETHWAEAFNCSVSNFCLG